MKLLEHFYCSKKKKYHYKINIIVIASFAPLTTLNGIQSFKNEEILTLSMF